MGKMLLLSPPLYCERHLRRSFQPPLNLLYLYAYLRAKNLEVELFEADSIEDAVEKILEKGANLVGIPLYYASLNNVYSIVEQVRSINSTIKFVAGGPCLTMEPERMMQEGNFDFGVIGEGEETLYELCEALAGGVAPDDIAGLVYRQNGRIHTNARRKPFFNLDELPFLDFTVVDNDYYFDFQEKSGVPKTLFLNSSRGCSFRCSYCCTPILWPGPVRRYSPQRMVDEIRYQLKTFPEVEFGFCDDSFFSDQNWLDKFLELVKPLGIKFQCIGRADHLQPQTIAKLVAAGMTYIAFGVETGNSDRQKRLQKNLNFNRLFETMRELAKYEVKTKCFFMLGFPDETVAEMAETINMAVELRRLGMDYFSIFPVSVYPGTELARQFPVESFSSGLDAHMPEIIRDGLEIDFQNQALLKQRFNRLLSQRQMIEAVSYAWEKIDRAESICVEELAAVISDAADADNG